MERPGESSKDAASRVMLDYRNVLVPSKEALAHPPHRRLAVLCLAVGAAAEGPEQVLHLQRRLAHVHCILAKILCEEAATEAKVTLVAPQPGLCALPAVSFAPELLDHEPFGTRGMREAFPAAMLASLFLPNGGELPGGVYCARLRGHEGLGVLAALDRPQGGRGRGAAELCLFRRGNGAAHFLGDCEASSATSVGGVLEDLRWLRPFYHGYTRLGPDLLRELINADLHAAVHFLWPGERGAPAPPLPVPALVPLAKNCAPLPLHLLAQAVLPYASAPDLGAWAPASWLLRLEAERCVAAALAADVAVAAGAGSAAVAAAISGRR